MLFQVYGDGALIQWLGFFIVLAGLILLNEFARRTKTGGLIMFGVVPIIVTIYLVAIQFIDFNSLPEFAKNTIVEMNGWFHYAKLYAALAGCIGFMMIKYKWGIGKTHWFKCFPFIIVAINILIAVGSDFESAVNGFRAGGLAGGYWLSSENVWLYGGWHNVLNGIAGLVSIFLMTGWWGIYSSKDKNTQDMLWPDMIWIYIVTYDIWNFSYCYNCLPTHAWYCGLALLLAPTIAALLWNKGGWIQNRANTLCMWCTFAQIFPAFLNHSIFSTVPTLYPSADVLDATTTLSNAPMPESANWLPMFVVALLSITTNCIALGVVITRAKLLHKNPYTNEIFTDTKYYKDAMARAEELPADTKA